MTIPLGRLLPGVSRDELRSVAPDALWEASDIVADIQDAYELAIAA